MAISCLTGDETSQRADGTQINGSSSEVESGSALGRNKAENSDEPRAAVKVDTMMLPRLETAMNAERTRCEVLSLGVRDPKVCLKKDFAISDPGAIISSLGTTSIYSFLATQDTVF